MNTRVAVNVSGIPKGHASRIGALIGPWQNLQIESYVNPVSSATVHQIERSSITHKGFRNSMEFGILAASALKANGLSQLVMLPIGVCSELRSANGLLTQP